MSINRAKQLWSKAALAAATCAAATAGITGLAAASSISNTGPGSTNVIHDGGNHEWWNNKNNNHQQCYKVNGWHNDWNHNKNWWDNKDWCPWGNHDQKHHDNNNHHGNYWNNNKHQQNKHHGYGHGQDNNWGRDHNDHNWNKNHNDNNHGDKYASHDNNWKDNGHDNDWKGENNHYQPSHNYGGHGGYGGHGSYTDVDYDNRETYSVENNTDVRVNNDVDQTAVTGDASSHHNTWGGDVSTGDATNVSENEFVVEVDNATSLPSSGNDWGGAHDWASVSHTGPYSHNSYDFDNRVSYSVENNTDVRVNNNVSQTAVSGDATSSYNTYGGNVSTGNASNYSSNSFHVSVRN